MRLNVLFSQLCLHFIKHFYFLRGIVLLESLWMALSFLARQRSLLRIRDLPLCLAAEIGIQHIPGFSNSLGRVRARLFTHANQRSVKGNDVSGFLIRDGSVLALRFRDDGYTRFIMFLHCPPTNILESRSSFTDMAEEYGVEQVIYAHGQSRSRGISTKWSIDWFPAIIWFGMLKYPQKIGYFHRLTYY